MKGVIEEQKRRVEREKEKLRLKQAIVKEREKKRRARLATTIGKLATKAGIEELDSSALLGAFMEIGDQIKNKEALENWRNRSGKLQNSDNQENQPALIVSFSNPLSKERKEKLRQLGFRWNGFRKEYYGRCNPNEIKSLCQGLDYSLETLNNE